MPEVFNASAELREHGLYLSLMAIRFESHSKVVKADDAVTRPAITGAMTIKTNRKGYERMISIVSLTRPNGIGAQLRPTTRTASAGA